MSGVEARWSTRALGAAFAAGAVLLLVGAGHPLREPGEAAVVDAGSRTSDALAALAGRTPFVARVPAIVGGLLALAGAAWAAAALSRRAAALAAGLLVLAPAWYVGARDVGGVGPALGATTIAAAGALHWMLHGRARDLVIAYVAAAIASVTGGLAATVAAPLAIVVAAREPRQAHAARRALLGAALLVAGAGTSTLFAGGTAWWGGAPHEARPTFELVLDRLGHGLFPWAGLLPIAIGAAMSTAATGDDDRDGGDDDDARAARVLRATIAALAVTCAAWGLAAATHDVGPLPAFALAAVVAGVWLDRALDGDRLPIAALVVAVIALLLARDAGEDPIALTGAGTRNADGIGGELAALARRIGAACALGLAVALVASTARRRLLGLAIAAGASLVLAATTAWRSIPAAARARSMEPLARAHERTGGGRLAILGGEGHAFAYLTSSPVTRVADVAALAASLAAGECAHAIAPIAELVPIQRALPAGRRAHVLARRGDLVLLSACLPPGVADLDPLPAAVSRTAPPMPRASTASWEGAVTLTGLDVPPRARPGDTIELALAFRVTAPPPSPRLLFVRAFGCDAMLPTIDRVPVDGAYPTAVWRAGDHVVDRFTLAIPRDATPCAYDLSVGWRDPRRPRDRLRLDPASVPGNRSQVTEAAAIATLVIEP